MATLLLHGLTEDQKIWLYHYSQQLGSRSRTKAILSLINEKMAEQKKGHTAIREPDVKSNARKRVQLSLNESDFLNLKDIAELTDSSIQHYIISLILNDIYSEKVRLLGNEIEQLKKSNYELHKIGVNINQIAKAINSREMDKAPAYLEEISTIVNNHIAIIKTLLYINGKKY